MKNIPLPCPDCGNDLVTGGGFGESAAFYYTYCLKCDEFKTWHNNISLSYDRKNQLQALIKAKLKAEAIKVK